MNGNRFPSGQPFRGVGARTIIGRIASRRPAWLLGIWAVLALALAVSAGLLWLPPADSARAQSGQAVPSDWPLIPDGIEPGDSFRLLFVTSATRNAASTDIADYNAHVQNAAGNNDSLKSVKDGFTALISTASVDAKDNTGTTGSGVPIHWLGGRKIADDYADLYDGDWDSAKGRTESGGSYTGLVWTGGNKAGAKSGQRYAGADEVRLGDLSDATRPLSSPQAAASSESYPLYAISPVLTVAEPEPEPTPTPTPTPQPEPPAITAGPVTVSSPASGDTYGEGEAVEVSVTFSEAVTVTGGPKVRLMVGEHKRWAHYSRAENDGTTLVFAYSVKAEDRDDNGISLPRNAIRLSGGTIEDADGNAAILSAPALSAQSGHKVDGSRKKPTEEQSGQQQQQQQSSNSQPAFAADTAIRSVEENTAAGTNIGLPVVASDSDNDTLTYGLTGTDAGAFNIDTGTGQIKVKDPLNYEAHDNYRIILRDRYAVRAPYTVTVTVSDGKADDGTADGALDDTIDVEIRVTNVNEPGTLTFDTETPQVGSKVRAIITDPDDGISWMGWWHRSRDGITWGDWRARFNVNNPDYTPTAADVGHYLRFTVSYSDKQGGPASPGDANRRTLQATTTNRVAAP